jgi:hypothetical protein
VLADVARLASLTLHSRTQLAAENLFLGKQLALYLERQVKPRRADDATRITLAALSRLVNWRELLVVPQAGHPDPLASKGLSVVLAVEIEGTRPVTNPCQPAAVDCRDGHGQSNVG